jgi:DNA polymerase III delta prime subunit
MLSTDPTKDVSWILYGTKRRTLLRPSHLRDLLNTKSSSSMRLITQATTYNSYYGRILRLFTCNYKNKIIEPLHSRCAVIDFTIKGKQRVQLAGNFFQRLRFILDQEKIEYDEKVVAELVSKHFPDFRRVLNEIQRYSTGGKIDSGILASFSDVSVNELIKNLKDKNFTEVRKWVVSNLDNDASHLLRRVYDATFDHLLPQSIPAAVLVIAKYQYQCAFVADQEINLLAALTEIMVECEFK